MDRKDRCLAVVYRRDTYRVDRNAKSGFSMHYNRCQCKRRAVTDNGLCKQHSELAGHVPCWEPLGA